MGGNTLKIISALTTIASIGLTLLSSWVDEKKLDGQIESKVAEALAKQQTKES